MEANQDDHITEEIPVVIIEESDTTSGSIVIEDSESENSNLKFDSEASRTLPEQNDQLMVQNSDVQSNQDGIVDNQESDVKASLKRQHSEDEVAFINRSPKVLKALDVPDGEAAEKLPQTETVQNPSEGATESSSISIKFSNESIAKLYKAKFLQFIRNFIEFETREDELLIEIYKNDNFDPNEWEVVDADMLNLLTESPTSKKRRRHSRGKKEEKDLFVLDVTPTSVKSKAKITSIRYESKFVVNMDEEEEEVEEKRRSKPGCFNCGEEHSLKDCHKPRDPARINAARQNFAMKIAKTTRYHVDEEQKFAHLTPGKISEELRHALGLRKTEIPHYVYLMRQNGYPPGWLEEAKEIHSNLNMFDINGKNVKGAQAKKTNLDPEKVVDFPGFNVPLEKGTRDDYRAYGVPPYSDNFSKEAMIRYINEMIQKENDDLESCDMDLDDDNSQIQEVKPKNDQTFDFSSLGDLEKEKAKLLLELQDEDTPESNKTTTDDDDENSKIEHKTPTANKLAVKTTTFGTPILKSTSPYMRLPNADNFTKDVSPVINFENLPNSTGKYEQMVDVLQKVRKCMKNLQNLDT